MCMEGRLLPWAALHRPFLVYPRHSPCVICFIFSLPLPRVLLSFVRIFFLHLLFVSFPRRIIFAPSQTQFAVQASAATAVPFSARPSRSSFSTHPASALSLPSSSFPIRAFSFPVNSLSPPSSTPLAFSSSLFTPARDCPFLPRVLKTFSLPPCRLSSSIVAFSTVPASWRLHVSCRSPPLPLPAHAATTRGREERKLCNYTKKEEKNTSWSCGALSAASAAESHLWQSTPGEALLRFSLRNSSPCVLGDEEYAAVQLSRRKGNSTAEEETSHRNAMPLHACRQTRSRSRGQFQHSSGGERRRQGECVAAAGAACNDTFSFSQTAAKQETLEEAQLQFFQSQGMQGERPGTRKAGVECKTTSLFQGVPRQHDADAGGEEEEAAGDEGESLLGGFVKAPAERQQSGSLLGWHKERGREERRRGSSSSCNASAEREGPLWQQQLLTDEEQVQTKEQQRGRQSKVDSSFLSLSSFSSAFPLASLSSSSPSTHPSPPPQQRQQRAAQQEPRGVKELPDRYYRQQQEQHQAGKCSATAKKGRCVFPEGEDEREFSTALFKEGSHHRRAAAEKADSTPRTRRRQREKDAIEEIESWSLEDEAKERRDSLCARGSAAPHPAAAVAAAAALSVLRVFTCLRGKP